MSCYLLIFVTEVLLTGDSDLFEFLIGVYFLKFYKLEFLF